MNGNLLSSPVNIDNMKTAAVDTRSPLMRDIYEKIQNMALLDSCLVIVGEHGSGKKWTSHLVHLYNQNAVRPFYHLQCNTLNSDQWSQEFPGQLRLIHPGNDTSVNALDHASGGTLFLEGFEEISPEKQLHIVKMFSDHDLKDPKRSIRLILSIEQQAYQKFRMSRSWQAILNYLNPMFIMLPPLRERREDIPLLVNQLIKQINDENEVWNRTTVTPQALYKCLCYHWPGNIVQLKNALNHAAVISDSSVIKPEHLPFSLDWRHPFDNGITHNNQSFYKAEKQLFQSLVKLTGDKEHPNKKIQTLIELIHKSGSSGWTQVI